MLGGNYLRCIYLPGRAMSTTKTSNENSLSYCIKLTRQRDFEHYLTCLLLPKKMHQAAFSLRAFNIEVAGVKDQISDTKIGLMRLQFWTDAINAIYTGGNVPNHPVVRELQKTVQRCNLSKNLLLSLILSRKERLSESPFQSLQEVEKYSEESVSSLNYLLLEAYVSSEGNSTQLKGHLRHSANHLGKAEGLVTILRSVPHNVTRRKVLLPMDLMATCGVSSESIIRNTSTKSDEFRDVIEIIASKAEDHLENSRFRKSYLNPDEKLLMLPAVCVDRYLTRLHRVKNDVFHPELKKRDPWIPILLFVEKLKRNY